MTEEQEAIGLEDEDPLANVGEEAEAPVDIGRAADEPGDEADA